MNKIKYFQFSLLACIFVFTSCDNSTEPKPDADEIKIADNTVIINDDVETEPSQITENSIEFEYDQTAPDIEVGDILVGYNDTTAYLRKVANLEISQGVMTAQTEQAALDEVIEQGGFEWSGPIEFDLAGSYERGKIGYVHPSIEINKMDRNSNSGINFSFNDAGINFGSDMGLEIQSGSFSFSPTFDIDAEYDWGLQEAHAIVGGDLDFDILAEISLSATGGASGEIPLLSDIPAGSPITIVVYGLPIIIYPEFNLFLGVSITSSASASLTGGIDSDNSIEAGFQWTDDNGFETIYEKSFTGEIYPVEISTTTNQTAKVYLKPQLAFMIYDAVGPHIALEPYIGESGTNYTEEYCTEWLLGITGEVGANIDILGYNVSAGLGLPDWNTTIDEECEEVGTSNPLLEDNFNDGDFTNNPTWSINNEDDFPIQTIEVLSGAFHLNRTGAGGNGGGGGIEILTDIDVNDLTSLGFDARASYRSVRYGNGDNGTENPINVQLTLELSTGEEVTLRYAYNYDGAVLDVITSTFKQYAFDLTQDQWATGLNYNVRSAWSNAVKITKVYIFGSGWDFEGYIDNLIISN